MQKKTQYKLLLLKELIDFDIMDFLYINHGLRYAKNILEYIIGVFLKR